MVDYPEILKLRSLGNNITQIANAVIVSNFFRKILFPLGGRQQLPDQRLRLCIIYFQ